MELILEALKTTGLLIWYTLWAFILGYMAGIQLLVTREQMARALPDLRRVRGDRAEDRGYRFRHGRHG